VAISGINHLTLAVRDLDRALGFYVDGLGCILRARWDRGAYLEAGALWLCLELDEETRPWDDDSHIAFSVTPSELEALAIGARTWKENRSEGASRYILDPDGHKLELHVGDLASRLRARRERPYEGMRFDAP
jgi:catechol 2,3-dioxygenase-like lactoylglutathione lyase family enzyme